MMFKKVKIFALPQAATAPFCPSEVMGSVDVPAGASRWRKWLLICGPAVLVSVGYIDPGNWATDIAAGSKYSYDMLCIVLLSSIAAAFLQTMSMRVGIVTGQDVAQLSRRYFPRSLNLVAWTFAEISIIACDIAEVLGAGLAFHLLFGCSLIVGIAITVLDTLLVLGLKGRGFREVEAIILALVVTVAVCFIIEISLAGPDWREVLRHSVPSLSAISSSDRLYIAVGIIGATVMPHNIYLHSSIVQTRKHEQNDRARRDMINFNTIDTVLALFVAFLINAAILILAASAFHHHGAAGSVSGITDAYHLLAPAMGSTLAVYVFGIALLASGQSATFTGTIAGQVILDGYLNLKIPCWIRRIITRGLALIPALLGILYMGDRGLDRMIVLSQVVLGLQLPFIMYPLFRFAADRKLMGSFRTTIIGQVFSWILFALIASANIWLLVELCRGHT